MLAKQRRIIFNFLIFVTSPITTGGIDDIEPDDLTRSVYEILKVDSHESNSVIRRRWQEWNRQLHPDKNPNLSKEERKQLEEELKIKNSAYSKIATPEKREEYDATLRYEDPFFDLRPLWKNASLFKLFCLTPIRSRND